MRFESFTPEIMCEFPITLAEEMVVKEEGTCFFVSGVRVQYDFGILQKHAQRVYDNDFFERGRQSGERPDPIATFFEVNDFVVDEASDVDARNIVRYVRYETPATLIKPVVAGVSNLDR